MNRLQLVENPNEAQVALALYRVKVATFESEQAYQSCESANPVEQFDNWLAPRMPQIEKMDRFAWSVLWYLAVLLAGSFTLWFVIKSY